MTTRPDINKLITEAMQTKGFHLEEVLLDITETICEIMQDDNISRAELARRLGKSRAWITKALNGERNLTIKTVVDILWELDYKVKFEAVPKNPVPEEKPIKNISSISSRARKVTRKPKKLAVK
ncbi:MAG: helix-turn-helix transcriptional regulator [Armatimonadota bacterium]